MWLDNIQMYVIWSVSTNVDVNALVVRVLDVLLRSIFFKTVSMSICQWQTFWVSHCTYIFQSLSMSMSMEKVLRVSLY